MNKNWKVLQKSLLTIAFFCTVFKTYTADPRDTREVIVDIDTTLTTCCANLNADFDGTFTTLAFIQNELEILTSCSPVFITQALVGTTGYTITTSGLYKVTENIAFTPVAAASAITIDADDVVLDLQCFNIRQTNGTADVNGIGIAANRSNIIVMNGRIVTMTNAGIQVLDGTNNLLFADMQIVSCVRGIAFTGTLVSPITNFKILGIDILSSTTAGSFTFVERGEVLGCTASINTSAGFEFINSFSTRVDNCIIENTSSSNTSAGIYVDGGGDNNFQNNIINQVSSSSTSSLNSANGILIGLNENNDFFINNQISSVTTSSNSRPFGIQMLSSFTVVSNSGQPVINAAVGLNGVEWSPNARYLAVGNGIGTVFVYEYDGTTLQQIASAAAATQVSVVSWSPSGLFLSACENAGGTGSVRVFRFDGASLQLAASVGLGGGVSDVEWSPDGRYVAIAGFNTAGADLRVFEFTGSALNLVASASTSAGGLISVAWSPDSNFLATGGNTDATVRIFRFTGVGVTPITTAAVATDNIVIDWSPDGRTIAVGTNSGGASQTRIFTFNGTTLTAGTIFVTAATELNWSPDGRFLAAVSDTTNLLTIYSYNGVVLAVFGPTFNNGAAINGVSWSKDGRRIAIGGNVITTIIARVFSAYIFPQGSMITNNEISEVAGPTVSFGTLSGRGISAASTTNLIIQNTAFDNDVNYLFVTNIYQQFEANADPFPNLIANTSFPPL